MPEIIIDNPNDPNAQSTAGNVKATIPAMLKCVNSAGYVTGAADILDESIDKDQQTINAEIVKHIPLGALLDVSPTVEQSSAAAYTEGYLYSYVWDVTESRLLLRVINPLAPIGSETKYYMSWNNKPTGMASAQVDLRKDFFYLVGDNTLTIYHWKELTPTYGKLVPTGSGEGSSNSVMVVTATHGRMGTNTQYVFDCDRSVNAIYEHIANGGIAVVKGSLAGSFQAILSGITLIEGVYCATGVTEINNTLYTLSVKAPINAAQSTLYANQVLNKMFNTLDNRITENWNNISELMYEMSTVKGASRFIPLSAVLTTSPTVSAGTLSTKKDNCTYEYVWSIPRKKLYIKETTTNVTPPRVAYYGSWTEDILGISSDVLDPMKCFFYSFGEDFMTIWHWKGNASTGELIPTGTDLTTINNYLSELSDLLGTIPSGVNTIGEFITDIQNRVTALENSSGGGGTDIDVDDALDETSTNPVENKAIKLAINHLQGQINQLDPEGEIDDYDYASDPAYPEHYGAKGDGIPYYDWPLACFNGFETDEVTIENTASDIEVFAPAERIMDKYGLSVDYRGKSLAYCSDSVIYNVATQQFLLKVPNGTGYTYYNKWANSDVWNSDDTGKARRDTVFSDISEVPASQKTAYGYTSTGGIETITYKDSNNDYAVAFRRSYIFKDDLEEPNLVEVCSTMTDDGAALADWFDANKGGVMKLRPGAIYYFRRIGTKLISHKIVINSSDSDALKEEKQAFNALVEENVFDVPSNTTIIGNGATLFPHRIDSGWPCMKGATHISRGGTVWVFYIVKSAAGTTNITIDGVNVKAMRDKDSGTGASVNTANAGNSRMSTSSAGISAVSMNSDTGVVDNIQILNGNFSVDCMIAAGVIATRYPTNVLLKNIVAKNIKIQNLGLKESLFDNVYMEMMPYLGHDGSHLFYFTSGCNNLTIKNSKFACPDPYRETIITYHSGDASHIPAGENYNVYYENCQFDGNGLLFGNTNNVGGRLTMHFSDCIFNKSFTQMASREASVSSMVYQTCLYNETYKKWEFIRCTFNLGLGTLCSQGTYRHTFIDCIINSDVTPYTHRSLFGYDVQNSTVIKQSGGFDGVVYMKGCTNNYPGPLGFTNNYKGDLLPKSNETEIAMIKKLFLGVDGDIPFRTTPLENPSEGDMYFDVINGVLKRCVTAGEPATCGFNVNSDLTSPVTATQTLTFNEYESITFNFNNVTTFDEIRWTIAKKLEELGYRASDNVGDNREPGTYFLWYSGSYIVTVTSKTQTTIPFQDGYANCVSPAGSAYPIKNTGRNTSYSYGSVQGVNPVWETVSLTGGLVHRVEALEE